MLRVTNLSDRSADVVPLKKSICSLDWTEIQRRKTIARPMLLVNNDVFHEMFSITDAETFQNT